MERLSFAGLNQRGRNAYRQGRYEEAARFFQAINLEKPYFASLFMEAISAYMAGDLAHFKRLYRELNESYSANPYLAELNAFIALKREPLDKALDQWLESLDRFPKSKKIRKLIKKLKKSRDTDVWRRHASLKEFISLPSTDYKAQLKQDEKAGEGSKPRRPRSEKKPLRGWLFQLKRWSSVTLLLLLLVVAVHSLRLSVEQGLGTMVSYWGRLLSVSSTNEAASFSQSDGSQEDESSKQKHLQSLLTEPGDGEKNQVERGSTKPFVVLGESALRNRLQQARALLKKGKRNRSLILINDTLSLATLPLNWRERFRVFKGIARAYELPEKLETLTAAKARQDPERYDGCAVNWQGRLDRVVSQGKGTKLWLNLKPANKESYTPKDLTAVCYLERSVGRSRVGASVEVLGKLQHRESSDKLHVQVVKLTFRE